MAKNTAKNRSIAARAREFLEAEVATLERLGIAKKLIISFPRRRRAGVPILGRVGSWLLRLSGAVLDTQFTDVTKNRNAR